MGVDVCNLPQQKDAAVCAPHGDLVSSRKGSDGRALVVARDVAPILTWVRSMGWTVAGCLPKFDMVVPFLSLYDADTVIIDTNIESTEDALRLENSIQSLKPDTQCILWNSSVGATAAPAGDDYLTSHQSGSNTGDKLLANNRPGSKVKGDQIVTVWGPKGGVGKTFLAVNLALGICQLTHRRCLLLDLAVSSGDIRVHLDMTDGPNLVDSIPYLDCGEELNLDSYVQKHSTAGLEVLLGASRPEFAEFIKAEHVKKVIPIARKERDFVIIDTPAEMGNDLAYESIEQSSKVVLVTTQDVASVRLAKMALDLFDKLHIDTDEKVLLTLNQFDPSSPFSKEKIEQFLGIKVTTVIPFERKAAEISVFRGRPIMLGGDNAIKEGIMHLVATICGLPVKERKPEGHWLAFLRGRAGRSSKRREMI